MWRGNTSRAMTTSLRHFPSWLRKERKKKGTEKNIPSVALIHIVQPVDHIKEGESGREYYPWPSIDGVHVCEVRDFDLELRGAPSQPWLLGVHAAALQAVAAVAARHTLFPVLDPWVVEDHGGRVALRFADAGGDLVAGHLVVDLQGGHEDVALGIDL